MTVEIRAIEPDEREACLDLWCTVWPGENSRAYFSRYIYGDVEWLPYYTQAAIDCGRIVSAVHICRRTVACGDFRLVMGGVANVATHPEFRGRGLNTACLQRAIGVMEADAMDFSLLFTGINGYYAREGYSDWPRARMRGLLRAHQPETAGITVRPADSGDIPAILAIHDAYNLRRPIAVQREAAYWRDWIAFNPDAMPEPPLLALDADGLPAGYVSYQLNFYRGHQIGEDYAYVTEIGVPGRPRDAEALRALLAAVALRARAVGKRELHLSVPGDPDVLAAMDAIMETRDQNETRSGMARLLHRTNLLRSVTLEWQERWAAAGRPRGEVVFETPYGPVRVSSEGERLRVEAADGAEATLSQTDLFGLLFGTATPGEVTGDPARQAFIGGLVPTQAGTYWAADGF